MNNPDTGALLPVTPEDRDLFKTLFVASPDDRMSSVTIDRGLWDDDWRMKEIAKARHRHQSGRTGAGEACWLIERRCNPPQWSVEPSPTGVGAFYSDIHRAHRFATKQNAVEAMRRMSITPEERGEYFVSEHVWIEHD